MKYDEKRDPNNIPNSKIPKMLLEQKIVFFCYKMKEKQIFVLFFRRIKNTKKLGVNHALAQCTQKKAIKVFYLKILEDFEF